ncbi:AHH domain-containing protein [Prosthecobacter sp.]|jgi:hypothetical protein|uniref:AHH domain-containing protein n=1 Tax=Prosthecobacter sp. TaxID=1965333 RepID=UPI0037CCB42D
MFTGPVGAALDAKHPTRWRLRCFNEVRRRFFAGEGGPTSAIWNDAQRISQQLERGVLDAAKNEDVLEKNMEILLGFKHPGVEFSRHHIMPTYVDASKPNMKSLSERGHAVLRKYGIGVNDGANGMYLPNKFTVDADIDHSIYGPLHAPISRGTDNIHTRDYLEKLVETLENADLGGETAVRNALQKFANGLIPATP